MSQSAIVSNLLINTVVEGLLNHANLQGVALDDWQRAVEEECTESRSSQIVSDDDFVVALKIAVLLSTDCARVRELCFGFFGVGGWLSFWVLNVSVLFRVYAQWQPSGPVGLLDPTGQVLVRIHWDVKKSGSRASSYNSGIFWSIISYDVRSVSSLADLTMFFPCCRFVQLTCLRSLDLFLVLLRGNVCFPWSSLSVIGLQRLVFSSLKQGFNCYAQLR